MITIKEIAKLAGVSPGTVDRVIHKRSGVSIKTSERVKKILKEHNFKINKIARTLAMKKKYKMAVLLPEFDNENIFWKSPFEGINKAGEELSSSGISVQTFSFNQETAASYLEAFHALLKTKPDGVVLVPTFRKETEQITNVLDQENIPYGFLNINLEGYNNLFYVGQDSYKSGFLAGKLMHLCIGESADIFTVYSRANLSNFQNISERINGFNAYFAEKKLKNVNHNIQFKNLKDSNLVKETIISKLKENTSVKGLFVPTSRASIIAKSLKGIENPPFIIGFDTTLHNVASLEADQITFLISQKSFNQGYKAIAVFAEYLLYNEKIPSRLVSPIEVITKENMAFAERKEPTILL